MTELGSFVGKIFLYNVADASRKRKNIQRRGRRPTSRKGPKQMWPEQSEEDNDEPLKIKINNAIRQEQKRKMRRRASSPIVDDDVAPPKPKRPKRVIESLPTLGGQILKRKIETRDVNTAKRIRRNVTGSSSQI